MLGTLNPLLTMKMGGAEIAPGKDPPNSYAEYISYILCLHYIILCVYLHNVIMFTLYFSKYGAQDWYMDGQNSWGDEGTIS